MRTQVFQTPKKIQFFNCIHNFKRTLNLLWNHVQYTTQKSHFLKFTAWSMLTTYNSGQHISNPVTCYWNSKICIIFSFFNIKNMFKYEFRRELALLWWMTYIQQKQDLDAIIFNPIPSTILKWLRFKVAIWRHDFQSCIAMVWDCFNCWVIMVTSHTIFS
jgi:hypothetical protein